MKSEVFYFFRNKLSVLNLVFILIFTIGSLGITGCESNSDRFKAKIASALGKAESISVFGISHDQSGAHEQLRKTMLKDSADFGGAVEALTNANSNGTVSQVPFETTIYINSSEKTLLKLYYCIVDGRMSEAQDEKTGVLIIPWEFRSNIRSNR
jgi:hypothetical protein